MYFPYLRGRQYELLALKELAQKKLISTSVVPVVEPIKFTSTFNSTLKTFADANLPIAIVFNPSVGPLRGLDVTRLAPSVLTNVLPTVIMQRNTAKVMGSLKQVGKSENEIAVILDSHDFLEDFKDTFEDVKPKFTLFPDERSIRRTVTSGKVIFEDKFNRQEKNSDYANTTDEFFSDDHLFFKDEGNDGFGDYSIIGNYYDEGGFAPKAVAIHIIYFDKDRVLRVHHFVSDSNEGIEDVAGKFYEAVTKLADWFDSLGDESQKTFALDVLLEYQKQGYYPGLPTIKKLSIMHHLELIDKFLIGDIKV